MTTNAKQRADLRKRGFRDAHYQTNDLSWTHTEVKQDTYTQGQLAKAAAVLMNYAATQQATRNLNEAAIDYNAYKNDDWRDLERTGYQNKVPPPPPEDWPFSKDEWTACTTGGYDRLLTRANAYLQLEKERVARWNQSMRRHGVAGLDPSVGAQLDKTEERGRKFNARRWAKHNEDMANSALVEVDFARAVAGQASSPINWSNIPPGLGSLLPPPTLHPNAIPIDLHEMEGVDNSNDLDDDYVEDDEI